MTVATRSGGSRTSRSECIAPVKPQGIEPPRTPWRAKTEAIASHAVLPRFDSLTQSSFGQAQRARAGILSGVAATFSNPGRSLLDSGFRRNDKYPSCLAPASHLTRPLAGVSETPLGQTLERYRYHERR